MKVSRILIAFTLVIGCLAFSQIFATDSSALNLQRSEVKVPVQVVPKNNTEFTHHPRKVTLRWRAVSGATLYEVEVDCRGCRQAGKWDTEVGEPWQKASSRVTSHSFTFSGDNLGRWRVRAVKAGRRSDWSPWWTFRFKTGETPEAQAPVTKPAPKTVQKKPVPKIAVPKKPVPKPVPKKAAVKPAAAQVLPVPQQFFLDFVDAYLVFQPSSNSIQIITEGLVLSYGSDWEKCRLRPYLYHIRQDNWQGFYWQVNTSRKEVHKVTGGEFCRIGGTRKKLDMTVDVVGGSDTIPPSRFVLRFQAAYLVFVPTSEALQITAEGNVLSYGNDWEKCQLKPYLYNLKQKFWRGFHWKINTGRKTVYKVTGGEFCKMEGSDTPMLMGVRVVD